MPCNSAGPFQPSTGSENAKPICSHLQYAPEDIQAMMDVKRRFDPQWLLGRETLFPVPAEFS